MGRPLSAVEAAAALKRGAEIEQFVALIDGQVTYLTASQSGSRYVVRRHVVLDEGTDAFRDISEFSPVGDEEYVGEGTVALDAANPVDAVSGADDHGGSAEAWVNQGMAAVDYWTTKTQSG